MSGTKIWKSIMCTMLGVGVVVLIWDIYSIATKSPVLFLFTSFLFLLFLTINFDA